MQPTRVTGLFFWGCLLLYDGLMLAPRAVTLGGFFKWRGQPGA